VDGIAPASRHDVGCGDVEFIDVGGGSTRMCRCRLSQEENNYSELGLRSNQVCAVPAGE
jgi:hypothetical protein